MNPDAARGRVALRIDVDFPVGLLRAVPFFLDRLRAAGMKATFFVVAGSNDPRSSWRRMVRPQYARRLWRLGPRRIVRGLGLRALTSDAGFLGSEQAMRTVKRLLAEGHELAVHGFDHAWWAANVWSADARSIEAQIDRAYDLFEPIVGHRNLAWGSPNWRSGPVVLRRLQRIGVRYFSECWGRSPFLTVLDGDQVLRIPHLPITLPSLESLVLDGGLSPQRAVQRALAGRSPMGVDVVCFHDYFEGLMMPELLEEFLEQALRDGITTTTLDDAATAVGQSAATLDLCRLQRGRLPEFDGEVSWQGQAVALPASTVAGVSA